MSRPSVAGLIAALGRWLLCAAMGAAVPAQAHEMTMVDMTLREVNAGQFVWAWGVPGKSRAVAEDLKPLWPAGCQGDDKTVQCGPAGLKGSLAIEGIGQAYSAAIVRIRWRGGEQSVHTLTAGQPKVQLFGAADDTRGGLEVATAYALLGIEHILTGWDHLLFVIGLLWLVGFNRGLLWTLTAFTVAHSLTLASSALGWLVLRSPPVEATIALSIVLVCIEALRCADSLTRRRPALVAFGFGLIHGLGFAGALQEIGLPSAHRFLALLTFNVGVELGQLAVVTAAFAASLAVKRWAGAPALKRPVLYAMGATASYWLVARLVAMGA